MGGEAGRVGEDEIRSIWKLERSVTISSQYGSTYVRPSFVSQHHIICLTIRVDLNPIQGVSHRHDAKAC